MVTIVSANVEANGWVLALTINGALSSTFVSGYSLATDTSAQSLTNFGAYALNPNGTPAMTLVMLSNGFVQSGTAPNITAIPSTSVGRSLTATKVLRKITVVTAAGARNAKNPDETDIGGGQITIRIALSQHAYVGDSGITLTTLAGWRTGALGETFSVTNGSGVNAPAPIVRWSDVPYQLQSGNFNLECVIASHHPKGLAPVAAVRFTVTDNTTIKTFWAAALSTSTAYSASGTGQGLRVYSVIVDPTTATALTKGLLRCDFKVFPWIGPAQVSDTIDTNRTTVAASNTPSMTNLLASNATQAAIGTSAQLPFIVAYNPSNAWITPRFINIDAFNGVPFASASSALIKTTQTLADNGTSVADIATALESMRLLAVSVVVANGQTAIANSLDGLTITIRKAGAVAGCTGIIPGYGGTGNQYSAGLTGATFVTVRGDPSDTTGRACIIRAPSTANAYGFYSSNSSPTLLRFTGLSIEASAYKAVVVYSLLWLDNVEVRGSQSPTDQRATNMQPISSVTGSAGAYITNSKWWQHGSSIFTTTNAIQPMLARNVSVEREIGAPLVANCARLPTAISATRGVSEYQPYYTDVGYSLERIAVGNDMRYLNGTTGFIPPVLLGTASPTVWLLGKSAALYNVVSRWAAINNVFEIYGASSSLMTGWGELALVVATESILEGNTFTGDRVNDFYNLPSQATIAGTDTNDSLFRVNRSANNIFIKHTTKHDAYNEPVITNGNSFVTPRTAGRIGVALGTSWTRNWAVQVGWELVIAGSPANVYRCTAVTGDTKTAATGGPTGTGTGIIDGNATWAWFATENRQHGYCTNAINGWSQLYGVMHEGNIDLENGNPSGTGTSAIDSQGSDELNLEFVGISSQSLWNDRLSISSPSFVLDKSGTANKQPYQPTPDGTGGGNYMPTLAVPGAYILGRGKSANVDVDQGGFTRAIPFAAGAFEALLANLTRMLMGIGS